MRTILTLLFCLHGAILFAHDKPAKDYIRAWRVSDTSQTHRAEESYVWLRSIKNYSRFQQLAQELYTFVERNPDDRLRVRVVMFRVLGELIYKGDPGITKADAAEMKACLSLLEKIGDDQLKAEFYFLYARMNSGPDYLLYHLKAVELQRRIGYRHFLYVYNRLFNISLSLYRSDDYLQSIAFGRECLQFRDVEAESWDPMVYIFQLDILGASYLKLGNYDSSGYYYRQIADTLLKKPLENPLQTLWTGIAKGNIGHLLILRGNEDEGLPMVHEYLRNSISVGSPNNIANAQNILAAVDIKHKRYQKTLARAYDAYHHAAMAGMLELQLPPLKYLAECYLKLQQPDSALKYYNLHQVYQARRTEEINRGKLSVMQARIAFDNMQSTMRATGRQLENERQTRNFILAGIFLLAVISVLAYTRQTLKARLLVQENKAAQIETEAARERISAFGRNIRDKEKLISELNKALQGKGQVGHEQQESIRHSLLNYTLVTQAEWNRFRELFSKAYPAFFPKLRQLLQPLHPAEERLASLIFLQLRDTQIAAMLGIGKDSVSRSKRRFKARINLPEGQSLESFIRNLD